MIEKLTKKILDDFKPYIVNEIESDIKLDANESPFDLSDSVKKELVDMIQNGKIINKYPDTNANKLRKLIGYEYGISKENVLIGTGSDQIISIIINAFVDIDDIVMAPNPSFGMYEISTRIGVGDFRKFDLSPENDYNYDVDELIKMAKGNKAKILFLCTPNNPTGNILENEQIERIICELEDTVVVVDEAYSEFSNTTFVDKVLEYENAIVLKTFSKAYGLAGVRCGYSIANEKMTYILSKALPPYNISQLSQNIASAVLLDKKENKKRLYEIISERNRIEGKLKEIEQIKVYDSQANYFLVKVLNGVDLYSRLLDKGILIKVYNSSPLLEDCYRITVGSSLENDKVLKSLFEIFK